MRVTKFQAEIATTANHTLMAAKVAKKPALIPQVIAGLASEHARMKYGCLKVLRVLSERNPELVYPELDQFVPMTETGNNISKWGAIIIIGNLARADKDGKIDKFLDRFLAPIRGPVMITAGNVIGAAAKIALAKPRHADRIARAVMEVERGQYQTNECRNVALGHAIKGLDTMFLRLQERSPVLEFVKRQLDNSRSAVRKSAALFLKKHGLALRLPRVDTPPPPPLRPSAGVLRPRI